MILYELIKARKSQERFNEVYNGKHEAYSSESWLNEYCAFSCFIQNLFISDGGYIMDTGNFQAANYVMMDMIVNRIKKHPLLWKIFFMIA